MTEFCHIAHIYTEFPAKFGLPRQSGLVPGLRGLIRFEPEFRRPEAFRGLAEFSHLWLLWEFSAHLEQGWSPTVRPPRLGGNLRQGLFATRSPFRPNPLGLSCVELLDVRLSGPEGPELLVGGADLQDGTPLYDIKPYLPYCDSKPEARGGFAAALTAYGLRVELPPALARRLEPQLRETLVQVLAQDPRPGYQQDPQRVYGLDFGGWQVKFSVKDEKLTVLSLDPLPPRDRESGTPEEENSR